jgi:hypothetical protein
LQELDELLRGGWQRPARLGKNPNTSSEHRLPNVDPADQGDAEILAASGKIA